MRVAAIQFDIAWEDPARNFAQADELLGQAAASRVELAVLPEMFSTGFSLDPQRVAEPAEGPAYQFLGAAARRHHLYIAASRAERDNGRAVNTAYLFDPTGAELLRYEKVHPFAYGGETEHYSAGSHLRCTRLNHLTAAITICYDLRFPELFRALTFRGANLFIVPANWPVTRISQWSRLLVARAIENQAFVIGANRTGGGGGLLYNGRSAIVDPLGNLLAEGGDTEQIVCAEIDPLEAGRVRSELPFLQDARRDLFPSLWPTNVPS